MNLGLVWGKTIAVENAANLTRFIFSSLLLIQIFSFVWLVGRLGSFFCFRGLVSVMNVPRNITQLVGEDIKILMTPELQQVHDLYLYNYLSLGAARKKLVNNPRNTQVMTKAGRRVPVVVKVTEGEFGGKIFFAVFFEDKTRFASMQEHIRRSENRILEALNISPESIVVISAATRKISFLNRQLLRVPGRTLFFFCCYRSFDEQETQHWARTNNDFPIFSSIYQIIFLFLFLLVLIFSTILDEAFFAEERVFSLFG